MFRGQFLPQATLIVVPLLAFQVFNLPGIVELAMLVPLSILVLAFARRRGNSLPVWELALMGLLAVSVLWGDDPSASSIKLRTYLPVLLATLTAASLVTSEQITRSLRVSFLAIVSSSLLVLASDPASRLREGPDSTGGTTQLVLHAQFAKNIYGGLLVVALILVLSRRRPYNLLLVPGLGILIAYNQSVTAWVAAVVLGSASLLLRRYCTMQDPRFSRLGLASVIVALFGGVIVTLLQASDAALAAVGKDPSLSNRTLIWAASWQQIKTAPWLGHGAFTFLEAGSNSPVTVTINALFQSYQPPHPHNGLLDLWGQLGLVGVLAFGALVFSAFRRALRNGVLETEPGRTATVILLFILLFSISEPTFLRSWLVLTFMATAILSKAGHPGRAESRQDVSSSKPDYAAGAFNRYRAEPGAAGVRVGRQSQW